MKHERRRRSRGDWIVPLAMFDLRTAALMAWFAVGLACIVFIGAEVLGKVLLP